MQMFIIVSVYHFLPERDHRNMKNGIGGTGIHMIIHYNCTRQFLVALVFADLPSLSPFIS